MNWSNEITKFEKFSEDSREHGRKVYRRYEDERESADNGKKINIFYANVNTQKESLYNSLPKPEVSRMHKGNYDDDVARVAALIISRALDYEINCSEGFSESIEAAILDRLIPGVGQVWVRFDADPATPGTEKIVIDTVFWEDFLYSPARSWLGVWWVGRRLKLDKADFKARFGEEALADVGDGKESNEDAIEEIEEGKITVYEIWDKTKKEVLYVMKGKEEPLKTVADPYKLKGFFPCPPPLVANKTTKKLLPMTDYHIAQDQYIQLDVLYERTQLIVEAIKVAGVYDAASPEIGKMLSSGENKLIPVDNWAMYAERGGAKGLIDWYPVEQIATVLQHLQGQMEITKQILYEVTGMSDIIRGASNQYETASAQQIKAQFASVRLNGAQRQISTFVQDILRIMAQIISGLYTDEKLQQIVGQLSPPDMQMVPQAMQIVRGGILATYKIKVEANSLTQADWALEKEQRIQVVTNLGQMLQQTIAMAEQVPEITILSAQLIKFALGGFKGATEIEGWLDQQLDAMLQKSKQSEGQPKPPSPEEIKAQQETQKMQAEMQRDQQKAQLDARQQQMEMQFDQQRQQMELSHQQAMQRMEAQQQAMQLMFTKQMGELKLMLQMRQGNMKLEQQEQAAEMKEREEPKGE